MRWFWKKKEEPKPEVKQEVKPEPPQEPKWDKHIGDWDNHLFCHCGHRVDPKKIPTVCPSCGCDLVPIEKRGRWEWETNTVWLEYLCHFHVTERNHRFVEWTSCTHEEGKS